MTLLTVDNIDGASLLTSIEPLKSCDFSYDHSLGVFLIRVYSFARPQTQLPGGPTQSTTSQNGSLRGFKMTTYEGCPRVPFISQWKGHWPAGKVYENPLMNLDVVPTMMAATGHQIAESEKLDGVDLAPFLNGKNSASVRVGIGGQPPEKVTPR